MKRRKELEISFKQKKQDHCPKTRPNTKSITVDENKEKKNCVENECWNELMLDDHHNDSDIEAMGKCK